MTLNEALLQKLAEWRPAGSGRHTLNIPLEDTGWAVTIAADRCDELGCLVWDLTFLRTTSAAASGTLHNRAAQVAGQVKSLLEPLKVVEVDIERNLALLRSEQPAHRNDRVYYFEALLRGDREIAVCRYQASHQPASHRQQVAFAQTHEALARVIGEVAAAE